MQSELTPTGKVSFSLNWNLKLPAWTLFRVYCVYRWSSSHKWYIFRTILWAKIALQRPIELRMAICTCDIPLFIFIKRKIGFTYYTSVRQNLSTGFVRWNCNCNTCIAISKNAPITIQVLQFLRACEFRFSLTNIFL